MKWLWQLLTPYQLLLLLSFHFSSYLLASNISTSICICDEEKRLLLSIYLSFQHLYILALYVTFMFILQVISSVKIVVLFGKETIFVCDKIKLNNIFTFITLLCNWIGVHHNLIHITLFLVYYIHDKSTSICYT